MTLKVGQKAPDFTLPGTDEREYSLSQYRGKPVAVPSQDTFRKRYILAVYLIDSREGLPDTRFWRPCHVR